VQLRAAATMNLPESPDTDAVFAAYIAALRKAFSGERWGEIERYAHRVWTGCCGDSDADWATIRERARSEWPE
jgi:hypothetical protein